jgi:tetratricopeptide (TPR) repeat protein
MMGTIQNDLGDVYISEERLLEAERAYLTVLSLFKGRADKSFQVAAALRNLAAVYLLQGRYSDADEKLKQASKNLADLRGTTAEDYALRAEILNTTGMLHFQQGKLSRARTFITEAIVMRSIAGIEVEAGTASSLNNLASIYHKQRLFTEAEGAYVRSAQLTIESLGSSHPELTLTLGNLGLLYIDMGRYTDAENLFLQVLAILQKATPRIDARILRNLRSLGVTFRRKGDDAAAERVLAQAVELARQLPPDPEMPSVYENYAELLKKAGKDAEARSLVAEARRVRAALSLTVNAPLTMPR